MYISSPFFSSASTLLLLSAHSLAATHHTAATLETEKIEVAAAGTNATVDIPVEDSHKSDEEFREPARPDAGELGTYAGDEGSAAPRAGKRRAGEEEEEEDQEVLPRGRGQSVKKLKTSMSTAAGEKRRASESNDLDDLYDICRSVKKLKTAQGVAESKTKQVHWCSSGGEVAAPPCGASLSPLARPPNTTPTQNVEEQVQDAERTTLADEDDTEAVIAMLMAMEQEVMETAVKVLLMRQAEVRECRERVRECCEAMGIEMHV
ncbi:hypothetical protein C8Q74DRAFT_848252 [Fomes fomentarius]|nr:hypothetical protein C8Q74DRAFT_848252 [Fomes fomentarius]